MRALTEHGQISLIVWLSGLVWFAVGFTLGLLL